MLDGGFVDDGGALRGDLASTIAMMYCVIDRTELMMRGA
jgi:hypothetical protein